MNDNNEIRSRLGEYVNMVTTPSRGKDMYVCPLCGSGSHGNLDSDGAFHVTSEKWFCHSCQRGGDIYTLYAYKNGLDISTDFQEIKEGLSRDLGVFEVKSAKREMMSWDAVIGGKHEESRNSVEAPKNVHATQLDPKRLAQIEEFASQLVGSPAQSYLKERGFTDEIIEKYRLGYDKRKNAVVIPYPGTDYYTKRLIDPAPRENKYDNLPGSAPTFIVKENSEQYFFYVTEGQLDALSIIQSGAHNVIASHYPTKIEALIDSGFRIDGAVIVADNDEPGKGIVQTLTDLFTKKSVKSIVIYPSEGFKDSNDMLKADPEKLKEILYNGAKAIKSLTAEPTPLDHFEEFLNEIQSDRFRPISTGLDQLDDALCGGFERKTLVTLASAPGVGKTAISQYILENMSANGHSVIYVNLEMDRSQLLSRSISRLSHEYSTLNPYREDMTAIQVRRGYAWTDSQKKIVKDMSDIYRERIAPRFTYVTTNKENTGAIDNGLKSILEKLTKLTEESVKTTGEAPLICIDYLQFIEYDLLREGQKKPDTAESIKMTLNALKQFAMKYNTVILVITANNRASNAEGRASMDSGRDTSNIEYSGDVMLSMVYTAVEEGWLHKNGKKDKYGNDKYTRFDNDYINRLNDYSDKNKGDVSPVSKLLSLKVVKGRSIKPRGTAKFVYDGAYYYFREDVSDSQKLRSFYQPEGIDANCIDGDASPMLLDQ